MKPAEARVVVLITQRRPMCMGCSSPSYSAAPGRPCGNVGPGCTDPDGWPAEGACHACCECIWARSCSARTRTCLGLHGFLMFIILVFAAFLFGAIFFTKKPEVKTVRRLKITAECSERCC